MRPILIAVVAALTLAASAQAAAPAGLTPHQLRRGVVAYAREDVRTGFASSYETARCRLGRRRGWCVLIENDAKLDGFPTGALTTTVIVVRERGTLVVTDSLDASTLRLSAHH